MKILVDISWMSAERLNASFSKYVRGCLAYLRCIGTTTAII